MKTNVFLILLALMHKIIISLLTIWLVIEVIFCYLSLNHSFNWAPLVSIIIYFVIVLISIYVFYKNNLKNKNHGKKNN